MGVFKKLFKKMKCQNYAEKGITSPNAQSQDNDIKIVIKTKIEELLHRLKFEPVQVHSLNPNGGNVHVIWGENERLEQRNGTEKDVINCYRYNELYCIVTFTRHPTIHGKLKEWALIEYADSLYYAERWMFEDGDMIPLDLPIEQIISELEVELQRVINSTKAQ